MEEIVGKRDCTVEGKGSFLFALVFVIMGLSIGWESLIQLVGIIIFVVIACLFLLRGIYCFSFPKVIISADDNSLFIFKTKTAISYAELQNVTADRVRSRFGVMRWRGGACGFLTLYLKNGEIINLKHLNSETELAKFIFHKIKTVNK